MTMVKYTQNFYYEKTKKIRVFAWLAHLHAKNGYFKFKLLLHNFCYKDYLM